MKYCEGQLQQHAQHGRDNLKAQQEGNWIIYPHGDQRLQLQVAALPAGREVKDHQPCLQEHCGGRRHLQTPSSRGSPDIRPPSPSTSMPTRRLTQDKSVS